MSVVRLRIPAACLLFALLAACQRRTAPSAPTPGWDPQRVDGQAALAEVADFLAIGSRHSGSDGGARAAAYLAQRLRTLGLAVEVDTFTNDTSTGAMTFRNVLGTLPGRDDRLLVLASHFDTKAGIPGFVGANDSGSSTGLLLALAEALQDGTTRGPTLLFAFLDGEECQTTYSPRDGLHGSRRLAAQLSTQSRDVLGVIVLDMVGDRDLTVTIPRNGTPALIVHAFDAAAAESARAQFSLYRGDLLDDHVPFLESGLPAVDLIDFEFGSAPGRNDYWHTPADTLDKLSPTSLELMGRVAVRMLNALSAGPNGE